MTRYTTFGVWNKDIKKLISDLNTLLEAKNEIGEWFYSDALDIFQKAQAKPHADFVAEEKAKTGKQPILTTDYMVNLKNIGFDKVHEEFCKKFLADKSNDAKQEISKLVAASFSAALKNRRESCSVQKDVTNLLADKSFNSSNEKFAFIIKSFEDAKQTHFEIADEIEDHIVLFCQFVKYPRDNKTPLLANTLLQTPSTISVTGNENKSSSTVFLPNR